jgi:hypothetical protein
MSEINQEMNAKSGNAEPSGHKISFEEKEQALKLEEQQLKVDELNLKIKELKKPQFKKLSTWTSLVAVIIAFGGVIGQNILSNIKSEMAELNLREAQVKKDSAIKYVEKSKIELALAMDSQHIAQENYYELQIKIDSANKYLTELKNYISTLGDSAPGIDQKQLNNINKLIKKTTDALPLMNIPVSDQNSPIKVAVVFGNAQIGKTLILVYDSKNKLISRFEDSEVTLPKLDLKTTQYLRVKIVGVSIDVNSATREGVVSITFRQNEKIIAEQKFNYQFEEQGGVNRFEVEGKVFLKK